MAPVKMGNCALLLMEEYTMMENEIEQSDETWTTDFVKELGGRTKELEVVRLKVA